MLRVSMPYMTNKICRCCGIEKDISSFRFKKETKRPNGFYLSTCKLCEKIKFQEYQKQNLKYFREVNRAAYKKKVGSFVRRSPLEMTDELRKEWQRNKSLKRASRAKQARVIWDKDFTDFVFMEAQNLRKMRNICTKFEWHVDHIIPLKGNNVCGLHVWNNFAVIPKVDNLRKGNYHPVHD